MKKVTKLVTAEDLAKVKFSLAEHLCIACMSAVLVPLDILFFILTDLYVLFTIPSSSVNYIYTRMALYKYNREKEHNGDL